MKRSATVIEMADLIGVHPNTIRRWVDSGIIKGKRNFRGWRVIPEPQKAVERIEKLLDGDIELEDNN